MLTFSWLNRSNSKLTAYLYLFRIFESTMTAGTVIMAQILLGITSFTDFMEIFIVIWLAGASISSWNDSLDVKEDRITHPERPIVSGMVSIRNARIIATLLGILSILIIFITNNRATATIFISLLIGILYSKTTKRYLLMKNLSVMITGIFVLLSIPWIYQKEVDLIYGLYVLSIAFLLFSYEILKDLHDITGDTVAGIRTLVMVTSPKIASTISTSLFILACFIMSVGFALMGYYPEMIISGVTALIIIIPAVRLIRNPSPRNSEITRVVIISIILFSLTIVAGMVLNRSNSLFTV